MGTPLSFVVLSMINAWSCQAFDHVVVHGDDAVGFAKPVYAFARQLVIPASNALDEYSVAIHSVGGEVNRSKTFVSQSSWTACETLARKTKNGKEKNGWDFFIPPPVPSPGLSAPVAAESRTGREYIKRQERVMKTLFPWVVKDARLHLPVEIGGLGYTGRGLRVSKSFRARLGSLVSRGADWLLAKDLCSKSPFRGEGLYPRPLVPEPRDGRAGYRSVEKQFPTVDEMLVPKDQGFWVPASDLVAHRQALVYNEYRFLCGYDDKRRRDGGRPTWTKRSAVFKALKRGTKLARPLSVRNGVSSLNAFAVKVKQMTVTVDQGVASQILSRTRDPVAELELGLRNACVYGGLSIHT